MRSRPALLVVCLLVTALAAMPLSARDLRPTQPASASPGWMAEMAGWVAALWESLSGLAGGGAEDLELPPPANGIEEGGETNPGGSCIDPNGTSGPAVSCG